jgi:hypothetical protein
MLDWLFGKMLIIWLTFSPFGYIVSRKIWHPCCSLDEEAKKIPEILKTGKMFKVSVFKQCSRPDLTIGRYNASAVKTYFTIRSLVRF